MMINKFASRHGPKSFGGTGMDAHLLGSSAQISPVSARTSPARCAAAAPAPRIAALRLPRLVASRIPLYA